MTIESTHFDLDGNAYRPDPEEPLNWLKFVNGEWVQVGTMPAGSLHPLTYSGAPQPAVPAAPATAPVAPWVTPAYTPSEIAVAASAPPAPVERSPYYFLSFIKAYELVGSRVTCNPPPLNTDQDVLCLVPDHSLTNMQGAMAFEGYVYEGSAPTDVAQGPNMDTARVFTSMRKGSMNYILTSDEEFYKRFLAATRLAKKFNLASKADRIALFQAVLYGN